jgi:catechol 2,3-dioxygenase-like lactoylglutathione lyase family enzyme
VKFIGLALALLVCVSCGQQSRDEADASPAQQDETVEAAESVVKVPLLARIHFNVQVTDYAASMAFYRMLGLSDGRTGFNLTNTHEMARALGMFDLCTYEFYDAEVAFIPSGWGPTSIDIIQFITPFIDEPPYPNLNHLGMAYAGLLTTDLAADVAYLKAQGVEFLSEPVGVPGNRFVFLKDPDGTFYQLYESAPPHGDPEANTHIKAIPFVAFNVSDFDRSREFYRMLGYTESKPLPTTSTMEEAGAFGLDRPFKIKGADLSMTTGDKSVIRLVQWLDPSDDQPPYPPPISHLGINRMAVAVANLDEAVAVLKAEGHEFLSGIAPCCSGTGLDETGIVHLIDPDGIFIELVGAIVPPKPPPAPPDWCPQPAGS